MKAIAELKHGLSEGWKTIAEGWEQVRHRASSALTRFRAGPAPGNLPSLPEVDPFPLATPDWGLIAGEVFEDRDRVVVRLEAPGLDVKDFDIEVRGTLLEVRGEKRHVRESSEAHYRLLECAYGSFRRAIELPAPVRSEAAKASYRNGVLRIELPKVETRAPSRIKVAVK